MCSDQGHTDLTRLLNNRKAGSGPYLMQQTPGCFKYCLQKLFCIGFRRQDHNFASLRKHAPFFLNFPFYSQKGPLLTEPMLLFEVFSISWLSTILPMPATWRSYIFFNSKQSTWIFINYLMAELALRFKTIKPTETNVTLLPLSEIPWIKQRNYTFMLLPRKCKTKAWSIVCSVY